MFVLKKIEVPLCDIAVCSGENCDVPDFLLHDKSPLKCENKKKNYNERKDDTTEFQLQRRRTEHHELKKLTIPLCDVTLCSSMECDIPDYFPNSKSISHPINVNKGHQKNSNICLTKTKQYESSSEEEMPIKKKKLKKVLHNKIEEDSSFSSSEEIDTNKKKLKKLSSSEEETGTKMKLRKAEESESEFLPSTENDSDEDYSYPYKKKSKVKEEKVEKVPSNEMGIDIKRRFRRRKALSVRSDSEYSSTEESESEFSLSSSNESEGSSIAYKKKSKVEEEKVEKVENHLSEYEKMVKKNRADRLAFLKTLKMDEIKNELIESVKSCKSKRKQNTPKSPYELLPARKSERKRNVKINLSEDSLYNKSIAEATRKLRMEVKKQQKKVKKKKIKKVKKVKKKKRKKVHYNTKSTVKEETVEKVQKEDSPVSSHQRKPPIPFLIYSSHCPPSSILLPPKSVLPRVCSFENVVGKRADYSKFINHYNFHVEEGNKSPFNYLDRFKSMKFKNVYNNEDLPGRNTTVAVHPSSNNIVAAGGSNGHVAFWNISSESNPVAFIPHSGKITHLRFNPNNALQIISSSNDGTVRCGDLNGKIFHQVFDMSGKVSYFDFLSPQSFLVSRSDEKFSIVDLRESSHDQSGFSWHIKNVCENDQIQTVNVHPVNKNLVLSASKKGNIRLWDLNYPKNSVFEWNSSYRPLHSAFFSPNTGKYILSSSTSALCIYGGKIIEMNTFFLLKEIWCENYFGHATWLPNSDDLFAVGSRKQNSWTDSRKIEIFNDNGNQIYNFTDNNISGKLESVEFHPSHGVMICSSYKKIFVFSDTKLKL